MDERRLLQEATRRYRRDKTRMDESQGVVTDAVIAALRAGMPPTEVADLSPFSAAYVRRLAREAGIPPAPPGPKPASKQR